MRTRMYGGEGGEDRQLSPLSRFALFFQQADVLHQIADLVFGEFAVKRRHPILALADDGEKLVVRSLLHLVRTQGTQLQVLAEHGVARSVFAVAGRAFCLVDISSAV